jgi:hypothetical protein
MTTNEIAVRENARAMVRLSSEQLQYIAHTEFVPKSMRGKLPAILACVAMGRELGLGDMVALRTINVIDGRAALSAEGMVALVRGDGHSIVGNFSGDSCTVTGKRIDNGDEMSVTWTREMAKEAGLVNKDNHKKYPAAMLWARGVSQLCRMLFPDCFAGGTHTLEEISEGDFSDYEELPDVEESAPAVRRDLEPAQSGEASGEGNEPDTGADKPSAAQLKKLNVLVGTLREAGKVTTKQVYTTMGRVAFTQEGEPDFSDYLSEDGELHWSPLRDALTKQEASHLIEWLTVIEKTPADPQSIPLDELVTLVDRNGVQHRAMTAAIERLFPGRSRASELTDAQRAELWADVQPGVEA